MRRSIMVFGCTLEDGTDVTTDSPENVSVRVHPDHSVSVTDPNGVETTIEGKWTSYVPRFN